MSIKELFTTLTALQAVEETDIRMADTNEQRFFLHLINDKRLELTLDGEEVTFTVWDSWDDEDEDWDNEHVTTIGDAPQMVTTLAQDAFIVEFSEDAEDTGIEGESYQRAVVYNRLRDVVGEFDWVTTNIEEFEPDLYSKAARDNGWELTNITSTGATARLAQV